MQMEVVAVVLKYPQLGIAIIHLCLKSIGVFGQNVTRGWVNFTLEPVEAIFVTVGVIQPMQGNHI